MKLKGNIVYYSVRDFNIPTEKLEQALSELGFEPDDFIPRNDFKSALIKALKTVNKNYAGEGDQRYNRLDDGNYSTFTVYELKPNGYDLDLNKQLTIRLDKTHGNTEIISQTASEAFVQNIRTLYEQEKDSLNSQQFRRTVLNVIEKDCRGFKVRPGGGVYFISPAFDGGRLKLQELFKRFREHMEFSSIPVYDDEGTVDALKTASSADMFSQIESLKRDIEKDFKTGVITSRRLENDKNKAKDLIDRIKTHGEYLREESVKHSAKLSRVMAALDEAITKVESGNVEPTAFSDLLKDI